MREGYHPDMGAPVRASSQRPTGRRGHESAWLRQRRLRTLLAFVRAGGWSWEADLAAIPDRRACTASACPAACLGLSERAPPAGRKAPCRFARGVWEETSCRVRPPAAVFDASPPTGLTLSIMELGRDPTPGQALTDEPTRGAPSPEHVPVPRVPFWATQMAGSVRRPPRSARDARLEILPRR